MNHLEDDDQQLDHHIGITAENSETATGIKLIEKELRGYHQHTFLFEPELASGKILHQGQLFRTPQPILNSTVGSVGLDLNLWMESKPREIDGSVVTPHYCGDGLMIHVLSQKGLVSPTQNSTTNIPAGIALLEATDGLSVWPYTQNLWTKFVETNIETCNQISANLGIEIPWSTSPDLVFQSISKNFADTYSFRALEPKVTQLLSNLVKENKTVINDDYIDLNEFNSGQFSRQLLKSYFDARTEHLDKCLAPLKGLKSPHEVWLWEYLVNAIYSMQLVAWAPSTTQTKDGEQQTIKTLRIAASSRADIIAEPIAERYCEVSGLEWILNPLETTRDSNAGADQLIVGGNQTGSEEYLHTITLQKPGILLTYSTLTSGDFDRSYGLASGSTELSIFPITNSTDKEIVGPKMATFSDGIRGTRDPSRSPLDQYFIPQTIYELANHEPNTLRTSIYGDDNVKDDVIAALLGIKFYPGIN